MTDLEERWYAFVKAHPKPDDIHLEEKSAMFLHGWDHPDRDIIEYQAALWLWRGKVMQDVGLFGG